MVLFRQSAFKWECDECGVFFGAGKGGVCRSCKRALCSAHLYGSILGRLKSSFSSDPVRCLECRKTSGGS